MESIEVFAGNIVEVGFVQSLLDKDGIQSWLRDEVMGTLKPWYAAPGGTGAIKVLVLKADFDQAKSIVEVFSKSGKIYAKVVEVLDLGHKNSLCQKCADEDKNKPILGLTIIKGLSKDGSEYNSGEILDPKNGKLYKCALSLETKDKLKVRGYIGFSLLGRTQYWHRVN